MSEEIVPGYVSMREAARRIGVTLHMLQIWIQQGKLRLDTVHVPTSAVSLAEVDRLKQRARRPAGHPLAEPNPDEDFEAWIAWKKRHPDGVA